jgi:glycosyltransferase involved in cell wall biosynthesis
VRVGLFTCNYRPLLNGLATAVGTYERGLRRLGHEVVVVAPRYPGQPEDAGGVIRLPALRVPTHHRYALPLAWGPGVRRRLAGLELDVYHAQHPFLVGPLALREARRRGRPLVFTYHTLYERYGHYVPGFARAAGRLALRRSLAFANRADLVIAPSPFLARRLRRLAVRRPIAVVPTGVELPPLPRAGREALRARLALAQDAVLVLGVGRLAPEKGFDLLLRAFARAAAGRSDLRLAVVGEGDEAARLRRTAGWLGLGAAVTWAGGQPREALAAWYAAADLLAFPSRSEAQGLVLLEAMGHGLPVVAVRSAAAADFVADGTEGWLTPPTAEGLGAGIVALAGDPARRARLGEAARRRAERYPAQATAERLVALYREAAGGRAG